MTWRISSFEDAQQEALALLRAGHRYAEELARADSTATAVWLLLPQTAPVAPRSCPRPEEDVCE